MESREVLVQHVLGQAEQADGQAGAKALRLRRLLARVDAVDLLTQCALAYLSGDMRRPAGAEERYGNDAIFEYIAGVALSAPRGERRPSDLAIGTAWGLATEIIELEIRRLVTAPPREEISPSLATAQFLFRADHLVDRAEGYAGHQAEMVRRIFEPLKDDCLEALGFAPADLPAVVWAAHALIQERAREPLDDIRRRMALLPPNMNDGPKWQLLTELRESNKEWLVFSPGELASTTGIPVDEVGAMLAALSCRFGCQPDFLRPGDENRIRRWPAIALPGERFLIPSVWTPLQQFVPWFLSIANRDEHERLRNRFLKQRDRAAEKLVTERLEAIFGESRVYSNLTYDSGGAPCELDALVDLPGSCIVVETKAHHLTDSARRGSADRVRKHARDIVDKALRQGSRAARFVMEGGRTFRDPSGHEVTIQGDPKEVVRIAVSLERIDPIALVSGIPGDPQPEAWIVGLADLMMVSEILSQPAEFWAFARARASLAHDRVAQGFMEADFLGVYLVDRFAGLRRLSEEHPDLERLLDYHAADLNAFFAARDAGIDVERPTTGVPSHVIAALNKRLAAGRSEWASDAADVMAKPAEAWSRASRSSPRSA